MNSETDGAGTGFAVTPEPILLRVFRDADGETHFDNVRLAGETRRSTVSTSIAWWSEEIPVCSLTWRRVVEEAPSTAPHNAPRRQLIVPLSGEIKIEVSKGDRR